MRQLTTERLLLRPFSEADFDTFVESMLSDSSVIRYYFSYQIIEEPIERRARAESDFWRHFQTSREAGFEVWSLFERTESDGPDASMIGWAGLIQSDLAAEHGGPELQYMLASRVHGRGYATEAAGEVLRDARERQLTDRIVAVVDIPNAGSVRVLEKLEFERLGQIDTYGSPDMYLYSLSFRPGSSRGPA